MDLLCSVDVLQEKLLALEPLLLGHQILLFGGEGLSFHEIFLDLHEVFVFHCQLCFLNLPFRLNDRLLLPFPGRFFYWAENFFVYFSEATQSVIECGLLRYCLYLVKIERRLRLSLDVWGLDTRVLFLNCGNFILKLTN